VILSGDGALERYKELKSQYDATVLKHQRPCTFNGWMTIIEVELKPDRPKGRK
jgi:hypothetical protein